MNIREEIKIFVFDKATVSDLLTLCSKITTENDAKVLLDRYREFTEFADKNLGYIFGYCGVEERDRLYKLFPVTHPVFGETFGRKKP